MLATLILAATLHYYVSINNPTDCPFTYSVKDGVSSQWFVVRPGETRWHRCRVLNVEFDQDPTAKVSFTHATLLGGPASADVELGVIYDVTLVDDRIALVNRAQGPPPKFNIACLTVPAR